MPFAVELFFDLDLDEKIRTIWRDICREAGLHNRMVEFGCRPHVSLEVFGGAPLEPVLDVLEDFARHTEAFEIRFDAFDTFSGPESTVFLAPAPSRSLLAVHAGLNERLSGVVQAVSSHYLPAHLVFHCTTNMRLTPKQVALALAAASKISLPVSGLVSEVGLVMFSKREVMDEVLGTFLLPRPGTQPVRDWSEDSLPREMARSISA